jgi:hypothetical protein
MNVKDFAHPWMPGAVALLSALCMTVSISTATAGHRLSAIEAKLVGSWNFASTDSTATLTYESDHTFSQSVWAGDERFIESSGTWRIEGRDIVREIKWSIFEKLKTIYPDAKKPPLQIRETIEKLGHSTLAIKSGITYKRGKRPPKPTMKKGPEAEGQGRNHKGSGNMKAILGRVSSGKKERNCFHELRYVATNSRRKAN